MPKRDQPDCNVNSDLLVITHSSSRPSYSVTWEREKERGSANAYYCCVFPYSIGYLPAKMTDGWKNTADAQLYTPSC